MRIISIVILFLLSSVAFAETADINCFKHCGGQITCLDGQYASRDDQIKRYGEAVGDLCDYAIGNEQELLSCEYQLETAYGPKLHRVRKRFKRRLKALRARCGK